MRIVFMGTPEFAVPSLRILYENGYDIVGVVTAPDKPKGRGKKLQGSPVKEYAESVGLKVLQPTNLKSPDFISELKTLAADLQVVVAFRMLPEVVWNMPPQGTFNLHGSLLPQYRGAAPINWAIINGETETGVTTFKLKHEIDTGHVLLQEKEPIGPEDTVGEVYERLMHKGAKLVLMTVGALKTGAVESTPQIEADDLRPAPKIHKETCRIDWEQSSETIRNFVRGLSPYPAAWTDLRGKKFKIFKVSVGKRSLDRSCAIGDFETDNKNYLSVRTQDGWLDILELQMEGKRRMTVEDLLRGYKFD